MPYSFAYAQSSYEVPISADPQVLINGIDVRSFGAELTALPNISLPGTRQQSIGLSDRNFAQYARDYYTGFNFDLTFQIVAQTPTDLNQKITDFLSFVVNEKHHRKSSYVEPIIVEFPSFYLVSDEGTVSHMGTTSISGSGTRFKDFGSSGDLIKFSGDSKKYHIKSIASNTSLVIHESPSGSASGAAYNLYRKRYLKARYSGSSSHSSPIKAPFIRDTISTSKRLMSRDITISFYTDEPYWTGSASTEFLNISGGAGGVPYNFHTIHGVGDAGFKPRISIPTDIALSSPKIFKVRHNFLANFDGDARYKDITNKIVDATAVTGSIDSVEIRNESVLGRGALYVSGGTSKFKSSRFKDGSYSNSKSHTVINYLEGHLSTWVRFDLSSSSANHYIIDFGSDNTGTSNNLNVYYDASAGDVVAKIGTITATVSKTLSNNSFYNIQVYWKDGDALVVRVNEFNATSSSGSISYTAPSLAYPNEYVFVGSDSSGSNHFNGLIDEVTVWSRVLTTTEQLDISSGSNPKDPMKVATHLIQTHVGTTGDLGSTGVDYVSCDDNEKYIFTQNLTTDTSTTPDTFNVFVRESDVSGNFRQEASIPTVTLYDDEIGERGHYTVTGESSSVNITALSLQPLEDSVLNTHSYNSLVEGNMPSPNEIGTHAQMDGSLSSSITSGGVWYSSNSSLATSKINSPVTARDDLAVSAWMKVDPTQLSSLPNNFLPNTGGTTDDKSYILGGFNGSLDDGLGLAIDSNAKPVFVTHRLNNASAKYEVTSQSGVTPGTVGSSPSNILTHTNSSTSGWHMVEMAGVSFYATTTGNFTIEAYLYVGNAMYSSVTYNQSGGNSGSVNIPITLPPVLQNSDSVSIKVNVVNTTNTSVTVSAKLNYGFVNALTKYLHEESSIPALNDNKWHHVAVIYEDDTDTSDIYYTTAQYNMSNEQLVRGKFHFYVDGVKYGTASNVERLGFGIVSNQNSGIYPSAGYNPFNQMTFPGSIRDVRVYSGFNVASDAVKNQKFVSRLAGANGNSIEWVTGSRERHWWKFTELPAATLISDKGYYGNDSSFAFRGANYNSSYSSNGRNQPTLSLSKSYFCDPSLSSFPTIGAFRTFNETDNYDSTSAGVNADYTWSIISSDGGINPIVGDKMVKMPAKSVSGYPIAGLCTFIPRGATDAFGLTVSGYYYATHAQTSQNSIVRIENVLSTNDFTVKNEITSLKADESNLNGWVYFELPFNYTSAAAGNNIITFLQPNDTGTYYFCGLDVRPNFALGSHFRTSTLVSGRTRKMYSSDTNVTLSVNQSDFRAGAGCLSVVANDDAQGVVYHPPSDDIPNLYHNSLTAQKANYLLSVYARKQTSGTGNVMVSALGLNGAGTLSGSVQFVDEIPVGSSSYSSTTNFLQLPPVSAVTPTKKFRLSLKDSDSFFVDGITLRHRLDMPYTKTSSTSSGGSPSYVFASRDLGVSLTNKSLLHYNNVLGLKSQGSGIVRIKSNVDTSSPETDNIIANSGGERYGSWNSVSSGTYSSSTSASSSGSGSLQTSDGVYQNVIGLQSGRTYVVQMDVLPVTSATVTFGPHSINVDTGASDTSVMTSTSFTRSLSASSAWQRVSQTVSGTDANYLLKVEGSFYLDNVSVSEVNESAFDSVLFSWHADNGGNPDNDNYLRLGYSSYSGFSLQRNNSGVLETVSICDVLYDSNTDLEIAFNWNQSPSSDPFTGEKNYGTLVVNGTVFGLGQSQLTSATGNYKHLIVGCQGAYSSGSVSGSMHVDAVIDGLMLSNRVFSVEEMIENYKAQEKITSNNDIITLPDIDSSAGGYFVTEDGDSYISKNSSSHKESIKINKTSQVGVKNHGLNDDDSVVMYTEFDTTPSSSFDLQLDYEPRFR